MSHQNFTNTLDNPSSGANLENSNQEEPAKDVVNTVDNVTLNISDISEMPLLESTTDMLSATTTTTIITHFQDSFPLNQQESIQVNDTINENLIRENEAMLSSTSSYYHESQSDPTNLHGNENMENPVLNKVDQVQPEQPDETQINEKENSNFLDDSLDIPSQSLIW
jgi:hypothetical protein